MVNSCVYFECKRNRKTDCDVGFFRFPTEKERRDLWLINCGNPQLFLLSEVQLRGRTVCATHFSESQFTNSRKNRLTHNAVPLNYKTDEQNDRETSPVSPKELAFKKEITPKVYRKATSCSGSLDLDQDHIASPMELDENIIPDSSMIQAMLDMPTPTKTRKRRNSTVLHHTIAKLRRQVAAKNSQIYRFKKQCAGKRTNLDALGLKPKAVRVFVNMQLCHKPNEPWTEAEKELALNMYHKSPALYFFMKEKLKFTMPPKSTIVSWLKLNQLKTGTSTKLIQKLAVKVNSMSDDEKQCVVLLDEMHLKKGLEYNPRQDLIEGFEDLGHLGRTGKIATHGLVFMARGLIHKWKIPVSYYVSSGTIKHENLCSLIIKNIEELQSIGLKVRAVTSDQAATNRAAFLNLGITPERPYFFVSDAKIFAIYDVPHLIKSVRNNLLSKDFYVEGKKISWKDIEEAYKIDKASCTVRAAVKITDAHIYPNTFQRMRVKFATQVFSNTMSATIRTAVGTGELKSTTALDTADFLQRINYLFDCLNSRMLNDRNSYACALSVDVPRTENQLKEYLQWVKTWVTYTSNNKVNQGVYCFKGLILTIQSVMELWEDLKQEGYRFLLTSRLNQDPVENLFAVLRYRGGNSSNPTAKSFRQALQFNMLVKLQRPTESSNCEVDEDAVVNMVNVEVPEKGVVEFVEETESAEDGDSSLFSEEVAQPNQEATLESCATVYVAGYVIHKTLLHFNCDQCHNMCVSDSLLRHNELFLQQKDYGAGDCVKYLKNPSSVLINTVTILLKQFESYFKNNKSCVNFKKTLLENSLNKVKILVPGWLNEQDKCYSHKLFLINHLMKCKLHKTLKWLSEDLRTANQSVTRNKKIRHLSNV